MSKTLFMIALLSTGIGLSAGYWLGQKQVGTNATLPVKNREPLYYRHPMNPAVTSPMPKKDEMGMDYVPVYPESPDSHSPKSEANSNPEKPERKILYYKNPMGLPDTSPVPKKDAMGMDYAPVYEEESNESKQGLKISTEKIQRLGVKTVPVEISDIAHTVRSVGSVEADERRFYNVNLRFDGYIDQLLANTTGQLVQRGQALLKIYSPALVSAQQEYLTAKQSQAALSASQAWVQSGLKNLADSSLRRLKFWDITESDLTSLIQNGKVAHALTVRSPATGIIMEKSAMEGARVMAGDTLFKIADLSRVWIIAEVFEQDVGLIKLRQDAIATFDAYPGQPFKGKVGFIYPTLNSGTRTVKVRLEFANPEGLLKPMMYAHVRIHTQSHQALTIPRSAVLESGRRTLVLADIGNGRFEPRPVTLGLRDEDKVEILTGLKAQERIVVSANFLIDAESNLKAALDSFAPAEETPLDASHQPEPPASSGMDNSHHGGM